MKIQFDPPSGNLCLIHIDRTLQQLEVMAINDIYGVASAYGLKYSVRVEKGALFEWAPIIEQLAGVLGVPFQVPRMNGGVHVTGVTMLVTKQSDALGPLCEIKTDPAEGANAEQSGHDNTPQPGSSEPVEKGMYYIMDTRTVCGNAAIWWRDEGHGRHGYTTYLDEAWLVTAEQAREIVRDRITDVGYPAEAMNLIARRTVDAYTVDVYESETIRSANAEQPAPSSTDEKSGHP